MELGGWDYLAVFVVTTSLTLVLTPLALRLALRRGILDVPGEIKAQSSPVPYLGGVAIVVSFAVVLAGAAIVRPPGDRLGELLAVLGLSVGLAFVGLLDDLRNLRPWIRLLAEVAGAVAFWFVSDGTALFREDIADLGLTVVWIVGVTNALNLLDNMDGLSAGVAAIAALSFFTIAASNGQYLVATLAIALCGCALGFLRSNFYPARIYMGDAGALFLGFLLAVVGIQLRFDGPTEVTFLVPILVMGVALFDTTLVIVNRLHHGRNPMAGGRDHTSHRLVFVGLPVPAAVVVIYMAAVSCGWLALVVANIGRDEAYLLSGWVLAVALACGVLLSLVPVYENSRRRRRLLQLVATAETDPDGDDEEVLD